MKMLQEQKFVIYIFAMLQLLLVVYIINTLILFNKFFSSPLITTVPVRSTKTSGLGEHGSWNLPSWFDPMVSNLFLLVLFYTQHSILKGLLERTLQKLNIEYLSRSVFNFFSALVLRTMMQLWSPVTSWSLWSISIEPNSLSDWLIWTCRGATWVFVIGECVLLDISDLLGWKQIVHHFNYLPPPSFFRSDNFNLTLACMRHPGFFEGLLLFWLTPTLSLDRLMCSTLLTGYVLFGFSGECAPYVRQQRQKKLRELSARSDGRSPSKRVRFNLPQETDLDEHVDKDGRKESFEVEVEVHSNSMTRAEINSR